MPGNTVHDALDAAVDALKAAGCESARLDAEVLLAQATGWDRAHLAAEPEARLPVGASRNFGEMVRRRVRREPVAYILGRKGFRRLELLVDRRVLIPRPETELLVDLALELEPARVIDVGTGSGAIALAVTDELDGTLVTAIDTSFDAVRVAQANAERLGLTDRVDVVLRGPSALDGAGAVGPPFDLLVANLPYVSEEEWDELAPEIRDYEPREALVPGPTGLEAIEALAEELFGLAPRPSVVALEIGAGQADEVTRLIRAAGYEETEVRRDLSGHDRVVIGR
ncbi:MAG TPA: peptide chain release factor N(5)-glutamine methyltransferase [Solirubrobacterales bacterium]|nr:peptide chain release factor N(5)-glutamine methyltransferase [Solirubrobacterales bacterium]